MLGDVECSAREDDGSRKQDACAEQIANDDFEAAIVHGYTFPRMPLTIISIASARTTPSKDKAERADASAGEHAGAEECTGEYAEHNGHGDARIDVAATEIDSGASCGG